MTIKIQGNDLLKRYYNGQEVQKVMYNWQQIRPSVVPPTPDYLCFTANTGGSTVQFNWDSSHMFGMPVLEYSFDKDTRTTYQWDTYWTSEIITLANAWDKVYFRNKSETPEALASYYYENTFALTGSISASGDLWFMSCKYSTNLILDYWFKHLFNNCTALTTAPRLPATQVWAYGYERLFSGCTSLTTPPELPATTLAFRSYDNMFESSWITTAPALPATTLSNACYRYMFNSCRSLTTLPSLPATTLTIECYYRMFYWCSNIKLSTSQWWDYQNEYMIPINWWWTIWSDSMYEMFIYTWWDWTWTPSINTTYYTSNTVI